MAGSEPFVGGFLNAVDAKGRVSLPASFRKMLSSRLRQTGATPTDDDNVLFVGEDNKFGCLRAYDGVFARMLQDAIEQEVDKLGFDPVERLDELAERSMEAFGASAPAPYDGVGRLVIPAHLRRKAEITDLAFFVGTSTVIQIWSPARFEAECQAKPRLLDTLRAQLADRAK